MSPIKRTLLFVSIGAILAANIGAGRFGAYTAGCAVEEPGIFESVEGGCKDMQTGRVWSAQPDGNWHFANAQQYCADLVEGGQSDWRMATKDELAAVIADGGYTHLALTISLGWTGYNWSSTAYDKRGDYWAVRLSDGAAAVFATKTGSKYPLMLNADICVR